ncbi:hypothetical protein [Silvibacterium sp.]|uniref:hypothetical protein n=1 Tax=Silvibacterium sp. TaxID=1964179 RepID=UPI0039E69803
MASAACWLLVLVVMLLAAKPASAVSCTTQSQMNNAQRAQYVQALRALEAPILAGNTAAVRTMTIPAVAASFDGIGQSIESLSPQIQGGAFTIGGMYLLNATDLKGGEEETQFFCSVNGSSLVVTVTIPQLPPGTYLLALLHATGVEHPQQVSMILQQDASAWKLAGFFVRPMSLGGREGVWYWTQARQYGQKGEKWPAYFYYQTAAFLLAPVDFISSPNLEKLQKETQSARPADLPGTDPMKLAAADGKSFEITALRTDNFSGQLDLVVNYKAASVADPVATRTEILEVMKALLLVHPELRKAFHGLWVYAVAPGQRQFAIEMPMEQIS